MYIGGAVTLTVMAVEGNLIRFGLESPYGERPDARPDGQQADLKQGWWEINYTFAEGEPIWCYDECFGRVKLCC